VFGLVLSCYRERVSVRIRVSLGVGIGRGGSVQGGIAQMASFNFTFVTFTFHQYLSRCLVSSSEQ